MGNSNTFHGDANPDEGCGFHLRGSLKRFVESVPQLRDVTRDALPPAKVEQSAIKERMAEERGGDGPHRMALGDEVQQPKLRPGHAREIPEDLRTHMLMG